MKRSLKGNLRLLVLIVAAPIAAISAEKAISHLLFRYAARYTSKGSNIDEYQDDTQ
jgi:hypothetical protein